MGLWGLGLGEEGEGRGGQRWDGESVQGGKISRNNSNDDHSSRFGIPLKLWNIIHVANNNNNDFIENTPHLALQWWHDKYRQCMMIDVTFCSDLKDRDTINDAIDHP